MIETAQGGEPTMDMQEFSTRVEGIRARLYRTAYLYLGNESAALDAVDEAVYKALRALGRLREAKFFETWLTRILINECKKERRRLARLAPQDAAEERAAPDYDSLPLREAIGRLPEELRTVVILRFFADYTLAQTAACLKLPQGTVATRQRRALKLLRLELSEGEDAQ